MTTAPVHPLDEREMVASWGYQVRWIGGIGNYLGEWMALIAHDDLWGFLWIGHTASTDVDEYELALPSCSWECRRDPACPHDWTAIETMSRLQRESIVWADGPTTEAALERVRAEWDGPSSRESADRALDAMLGILRAGD